MKTLTIIKAIGAGVTALYLGGKTAQITRTTSEKTETETRTAEQWFYAVDEFVKALEELQAKPEAERGPRKLRTVHRATDLNYGGDES